MMCDSFLLNKKTRIKCLSYFSEIYSLMQGDEEEETNSERKRGSERVKNHGAEGRLKGKRRVGREERKEQRKGGSSTSPFFLVQFRNATDGRLL